jgi:hypothetical protein
MEISNMSIDASVFRFTTGSHLEYIKIAYTFLIEVYQEQIKNRYNASENDENTIRDDLVKIAKKKKNIELLFNWITEYTNIENKTRIDIAIVTPQSFGNDAKYINIECKIVGEDKYIDNKKSFERKTPTNGIMSFISGKYASQMPLAGMIGFIKEGKIETKINKIENRLKKHDDITTHQNLTIYPINKNFGFCYHSIHDRENELPEISIYHLFFDFT